ncbi:MAG TPA: glycine betaine ABC transporter substrate-binding protein [Bryobacteraceae bacterium]|jgi:glycine betaine/choline ABC-type transport system substrate-binding protein
MAGTKTLGGLVALLGLCGCSTPGAKAPIHVGSKNFTEQVVLGEIIAQHLEHRLHRSVERSLNLGGTLLAQQALVSGQIDLYPEYTGTALVSILKDPIDTDPSAVLARVRAEYLQRFKAEWLGPLGIDDTFAMVINGAQARAQQLETLTDAAKAPEPWTLGVGYEFEQRADGLPALEKTYHLHWKGSPKTMDLGLLYKAMEQGQVTMIAANSTDGMLSKMDLRVLRDDQHAFPPYQVCIVARQESMKEIPGLREALLELSGKFTNEKMQNLNFQVDAEHHSVAQVAADFLKQAGLE